MSEESNENRNISTIEADLVEVQPESQAALTIVVQSWATPILSILMLVVGLFGGYFGRPLLEVEQNPAITNDQPSTGAVTVPTPDADLAAQQQDLMDLVVSQTRHFQGDPNAPVTIIEFSDFK
jgi:protein-disulfide isomerase